MDRQSGVDWQLTPFLGVSPPQAPPGTIPRPELITKLNDLSRKSRVVQVVAPAGFGKTIALSEWSRQHDGVVAWITATAELQSGQRMFDAVISSLQTATETHEPGPVRAVHGLERSIDNPSNWRALLEALATDRERTVLVIDDAHLVPDAFDKGVLAELTREGSALLRLVIGTRTSVPALARGGISGAVATMTSDELAFSLGETSRAGDALDRPMSPAQLEAVQTSTQGWPAGVRLSLLSRVTAPTPGRLEALPGGLASVASVDDARRDLLLDYLQHETLDQLPRSLSEFVVAGATFDEVTAELAEQLTGRRDAAAQLELAVKTGLFVERLTGPDGRATYRWHQMFAAGCRAILERTDPHERARLNRVAASCLRETMPLRAVSHALQGSDPELAHDILASCWLKLLIHGDAAALEERCALLPDAMQQDMTTLLIRACARDVQGDRLGARLLLQEARSTYEPEPGDPIDRREVAYVLTQLMVEDDHATLMAACDRAEEILSRGHGLSAWDRNAALFLLGWTELRLRRNPQRAIALLTAAHQAARIAGDHVLEYRARSNLGFALAFAGDFVGAHASLEQVGPGWDGDAWTSYDGGIESFTAGFVAYWQDRLVPARHHFDDVLQYGGDASYAALARIFIAHVAADSGDPRAIDEAEIGLRLVTGSMAHGMPWDTYVLGARARLAAARGEVPRSVELANSLPEHPAFVPTVTVHTAAIHLRAGDLASVLRLLQRLSPLSAQPVYVRVSALLLNALVQSRRGQRDSAHRLVESALVLAEPQDVGRPFRENHIGLRRLLLAHAEHGTRHERWLAARIAAIDLPPDGSPASMLSKREREVLSYLRGTMTNAQIADALYVSVNTLKTHQRIIYRKLGVTSRREAVSLTKPDNDS